MDDILQNVIRWAGSEESIRALILTSSRAGAGQVDEFSDYDIMVLTDEPGRYLTSDSWMKEIGSPWVYQKEQFAHGPEVIPTRLVIFARGARVDFSFWILGTLREFARNGFSASDDLNRGYQVLMDRDGITKTLPRPAGTFFRIPKPSRDEFLTAVYDFWFEMAGVAKYLARGDLFVAKRIDNGVVKDLLLRMIIWNAQAKRGWDADTHAGGKRMRSWVDAGTMESLAGTYSGFNPGDSWRSLTASMDFFRTTAGETSRLLGYDYPQAVDKEITGYIDSIRRRYPAPT